MHKVTLEINSSIYKHIMFFLDNLPKHLVSIKQDIQSKPVKSTPTNSSFSKLRDLQGVGKELYNGVDTDKYLKELRDEW